MKKLFAIISLLIVATTLMSQTILTQGFESGMGGWWYYSSNTENEYYTGTIRYRTSAHTGNEYFQFSSYVWATDYNQYLVSPRFTLTDAASLEFFCIDTDGQGGESLDIMVSTTDSALTSFTNIATNITPTSSWQRHTITLPANTRFVCFHYTSVFEYMTGIDDIVISQLSSTPEIALSAVTPPDFVTTNTPFDIDGTITNLSSTTITSFDVACTLLGQTTTTSISNVNIPLNTTHTFSISFPNGVSQVGNHPVTLTVSNPNGVADNTADNALTDTLKICGTISALPYHIGFESGLECWSTYNANTSNPVDIVGATSGDAYFRFNSWYGSSSNLQMLISPECSFTVPTSISFYAKDVRGYGNEKVVLCYSTTDDAPTSFLPFGDTIVAPYSWSRFSTIVPTNAHYVAFKYITTNGYYLGIDNVSFEAAPTTPEIELTLIHAPRNVGANNPFTIDGEIVNHSAAPLTSFDVSYTVYGQTTTSTITGINVEYNHSLAFNCPVQATVPIVGQHTITLTVSNPNGSVDDTSDNTLTTLVDVYNTANTVRRKVLFEHFSTAGCPNCIDGHANIEENIAGYEDDIIWVTHHVGYYTDRLTISESSTFIDFFNDRGGSYAPACMLDRTYFGEYNFTHGTGTPKGPVFFPWHNLNEGFDLATTIPAYVTVQFDDVVYDSVSRQLTFTVDGTILDQLDIQDPRLNIWLLEDGILGDGAQGPGHGPVQSNAGTNFVHNHVIRQMVNANVWGDGGIITNVQGATYSHTDTITISNEFVASQCYLVAFVSEGNHSDINNCRVYNAEKTAKLMTYTQSLGITYNSRRITSGDTIRLTVHANEQSDLYLGYSNQGNTDITLSVTKTEEQIVPGTVTSFTLGGIQYTTNTASNIPLAAHTTVPETDYSNALRLSFFSPGAGESLLRYTVANESNPSETITLYVKYLSTVDIDIATDNLSLIVYPNPATDILYLNEEFVGCHYAVYSLNGQRVLFGKTAGNIAVRSLASGSYLLQVEKDGHLYQERFVIR